MKKMTMKLMLTLIFLFVCTTQVVVASHDHDVSVEGLLTLVEQLQVDGEFENNGAVQSLKAMMESAAHFEDQGDADKTAHHLTNFKDKLDQHLDEELISAEGYVVLEEVYELIVHNREWLTIVRDGQANAVIIISDDADSQVSASAATLAEYVEESTGAVLPVMTSLAFEADQETFAGHARVFVGQPAPGDEAEIQAGLDGIDEQGFMIHPDGLNVTIIGPTVYGTSNGVYDFLERFVGVRWLMIGPDGDDVPQLSDIDVAREDVIEEPVFKYRYISARIDGEPWSRFNKLQTGNSLPIDFMHNLFNLFPPAEFTEHPEFYPNGVPDAGDTRSWNPCFSTATKDAAVAEIIAYFDNNPDESSYSLGINDSKTYCENNTGYGDYPTVENSVGDLHMSEIYYAWVNDVVAGVLAEHPDKWFGLLAYDNVTDPPAFELNDRVVPFFTKDRMSWIDEEVKAEGHALMDEWKTKASQVGWYDYMYGTHYVVPRVYPQVMAENFKYAAELGVYGHYIEMYHNAGDGPKSWVAAKLLWDPYQDVDALLQEWYERAVGVEAADELAALYEIWEGFWTEDIKQSQWFESGKTQTYLNFNAQDYMYLTTEEDIEQSMSLVESMVEQANQTGTDAQIARVEKIHKMFEYYEASVLSYPRPIDPIEDETGALSLLNQIEDNLNDRVFYVEERERLRAEFENDPALRFRSSRWYKWSPWNSSEFWYLANYISENEPDGGPVRDQVDSIVEASEESEITGFAEMLQGVYEGTLTTMTTNSSYEDGSTDAPGWNFWNPSGTGSIERVEGISHSGNASVLLDGVSRAGTYQIFDIATGLTASEVKYYSPEGTTSGGVRLVVSLQSETGRTLADLITPTVSLADTAGEWASIGVFEKIPKYMDGQEVKRVLINAQVYAPDAQVYLDDVDFYQIEIIEDDPEPVVEDPILTKNSSFELGSTNATDWSFWTTNSIGSIERVEGIARTGNASLLIDHLEERGAPLQAIDAVEGEVVTKVYMYVPEGTVTENATIELKMDARSATNSRLLTYTTGRVEISDTGGEWIPVEVRGRIPAEVDGVEVDNIRVIAIFTDAGDLQVYLDDFTVTKELTVNSSFEQGGTQATDWSVWTSSNVGSIERVEGNARTGDASLLVDHLQDRGGPHQTFEAPEGETELLAQLYFSTPSGTVTADATVELTMHLQDENGSRLTSIRSDRTAIVDTSGEWVPVELSGTIPAEVDGVEVDTVRVIATFTRAGDVEVNIDDFTVTRVE